MTKLIGIAIVLALVPGCSKKDSDKKTKSKDKNVAKTPEKPGDKQPVAEPTAAKPAPSDATIAEPVVDEKPEQIAAQCKRILDKSWQVIQPAMRRLKMTGTKLAENYKETGYKTKTYLERCAKLAKRHRDCLEKAASPVSAIKASCKVNPKNAGNNELRPVPMPGKSPLFAPRPFKGSAQANIRKLQGTWELKFMGTSTLTVKGPNVTVVRRRHNGAIEKKRSTDAYKMSFPHANQMELKYAGSNSQTANFFWVDDNTFYRAGNMNYNVWPLNDEKTFLAKNEFDYIFVDSGKCNVATYYGQLLPATCGFGTHKGKRAFTVTYQVPGEVKYFKQTEAKPTVAIFYVINKHVVSEKLPNVGTYKRKK